LRFRSRPDSSAICTYRATRYAYCRVKSQVNAVNSARLAHPGARASLLICGDSYLGDGLACGDFHAAAQSPSPRSSLSVHRAIVTRYGRSDKADKDRWNRNHAGKALKRAPCPKLITPWSQRPPSTVRKSYGADFLLGELQKRISAGCPHTPWQLSWLVLRPTPGFGANSDYR
jgi:hypothetical protein